MATTLLCPNCGRGTNLGTIEKITGIALLNRVERQSDGETVSEFDDETKMDWDSSVTVGVTCRDCWWEHVGDDWAAQLLPAPTIAEQIRYVLVEYDQRAATSQDPSDPGDDLGDRVIAAHKAAQGAIAPFDPRVDLLAELVPAALGAGYAFTDWVNDLYAEVLDLLPTVLTATTE